MPGNCKVFFFLMLPFNSMSDFFFPLSCDCDLEEENLGFVVVAIQFVA